MNPVKIAPSLLAADFTRLAEEIKKVEQAGCDLLHLDVMDGHFVPNITIGPFIVKQIRQVTRLPLDVHLMIERPEKYIGDFVEAGSDSITIHAEACPGNLDEVIEIIHSHAVRCGVSVKPETPLRSIHGHLENVDLVLLMTVSPGFGGQSFKREVLQKVTELRARFKGDIAVDGGINADTGRACLAAGANVLIAGTAIFKSPDVRRAIEELRCRK